MSDFHQSGVISTLHRFHTSSLEQLEGELEELGRIRSISLVLPALYSELKRPALRGIVEQLKEVRYLYQIIVALGSASREEFEHAREYFSVLPQKVQIIWIADEPLGGLYRALEDHKLRIETSGKGFAVWLALGYALAEGTSYMVALHDCDIVTYDRELLARLCYPIANPNLNYEFCKGYYARVADRIYGRVTRLFVTPLIRAAAKIVGHTPFLVYLDSFRYPLAGEFSMTAELARTNRVHGDWGLDLGVLAEVFRNSAPKRVCQVDLLDDAYEHKHQKLSENDPTGGLFRMSIDVARVFFQTLASEGTVVSRHLIRTLLATYRRTAEDTIKRFHDNAMINNLPFDRHQESLAVLTFAEGLRRGGEDFVKHPMRHVEIPNWNRVAAAMPDFLPLLKETIENPPC